MPDDDRYQQHDRELTTLAARFEATNANLDQAVDRVQLLVEQYHDQNVKQAQLDAKITQGLADISEIKRALETKFALQSDFLVIRNQLWAGIGVLVLGILASIGTWIAKGGLASGVR